MSETLLEREERRETPETPTPAEIARVLGQVGHPRAGRRLLKWSALAAAAVLASFGGYRLFGGSDVAAAYRTSPVERGTLTVRVSATGTLQPTDQVEVGSELSGIVDAVYVDFNDSVALGQALARLDTSKLEAQRRQLQASVEAARARVAESEASVAEARLNLERTRELFEAGLVSLSSLDANEAAFARSEASGASARAQLSQSEASLETLEADLQKAVIRSPVDGVVLGRNVETGQTVAASLQAPVLFTIAEDLERMALHVDVDEADVSRVSPGQAATFTVDAYPERTFPATLQEVRLASRTVEGVVTYEAVLDVDNDGLLLRPGMTATADIEVERIEDALLVPNAALRFRPAELGSEGSDGSGGGLVSMLLLRPPRRERPDGNGRAADGRGQLVWKLQEGEPSAVPVTLGPTDGTRTVVQSGELDEGTPLVVDVGEGKGAS